MANQMKAHPKNGCKVTQISGLCYMNGDLNTGFNTETLSNQGNLVLSNELTT